MGSSGTICHRGRNVDTMNISAVQKTTLLDYPGHLACTVFLPGCNLRCPYCHNASLVLPQRCCPGSISPEALLRFLEKRAGLLEGVCITGGEPTLHRELPALLRQIRQLGYLTKRDTNGSNPRMLSSLLEEGLLDYVAMDIKNSPARYRETCGGADIFPQARESAAMLMESGIEYEFRTTVCHPFHDPAQLKAIGAWLRGAKRYFLQPFVDSGDLVGSGVSALTDKELEALRNAVISDIPNTTVRGL